MTAISLVCGCAELPDRDLVGNGGKGEEPDKFHLQYDSEAESVTEVIVRATAFVKNVPQTELTPLAHVLDPDALQMLFETNKERSNDIEVTFEYEGLEITVNSDHNIWLTWI